VKSLKQSINFNTNVSDQLPTPSTAYLICAFETWYNW